MTKVADILRTLSINFVVIRRQVCVISPEFFHLGSEQSRKLSAVQVALHPVIAARA